jgi:hypothetical protein
VKDNIILITGDGIGMATVLQLAATGATLENIHFGLPVCFNVH